MIRIHYSEWTTLFWKLIDNSPLLHRFSPSPSGVHVLTVLFAEKKEKIHKLWNLYRRRKPVKPAAETSVSPFHLSSHRKRVYANKNKSRELASLNLVSSGGNSEMNWYEMSLKKKSSLTMLTSPSHRRRNAFSRAVRRILSGQWRGFCGFPLHDAPLLLQEPQFKLHIPRTTLSQKCFEKDPGKLDSSPPCPPPLLPPSSFCRSDQSALPRALICVGGVQRVKGDVEEK